MTEKPAPHFGSLARVMLVGELAGRHVVDEQLPTGPQGGNRRVEPFPFPALRIGEDQVETAGPAGDFQGVTGEEPDLGRPAVLRGERRGRDVDLDGDDFHVVPAPQAVNDPRRARTRSGTEL
jgi:hypothetical protein